MYCIKWNLYSDTEGKQEIFVRVASVWAGFE